MSIDLKNAILGNPFLEKLRNEASVDREAFEALCHSLTDLEVQLRGANSIDKELAQELYVIAPVTKNMASALAGHNPDLARELAEMAVKLDALVLNCLAT